MSLFLLLLCWMFDRAHGHFCASGGPAGHQRNHRYADLQCHTRPQSPRQVPVGLSLCMRTYMSCLSWAPVSVVGCLKNGMHRYCSFRWERGGKPLLPTSGGRVSVGQSSLTIGQTWSGDIGDYTCTVTSAAGNDSRTARLEVM